MNTYRINPAMELRWNEAFSESQSSLVAFLYERGRTVPIADARYVNVLAYATKSRSYDELVETLASDELPRTESENAVEDLIDTALLLPAEDDLFERVRPWLESSWRRGLYYYLDSVDQGFEYSGSATEPSRPAASDVVALPDPREAPDVSLRKVLLERRSHREFSNTYLEIQDVADLLFHTCHPERDGRVLDEFSSFAYAGTDLFLLAPRVYGLDCGLYRYDAIAHELRTIRAFDSPEAIDERLAELVNGQQWGEGAALTCLPVFDVAGYRRVARGPQAHQHTYQFTAMYVQRFLLMATALELRTWLTAAGKDSDLNELAGVTWPSKSTYYVVSVGE